MTLEVCFSCMYICKCNIHPDPLAFKRPYPKNSLFIWGGQEAFIFFIFKYFCNEIAMRYEGEKVYNELEKGLAR